MAPISIVSVFDQCQVSPPPTATIGDTSLVMNYMDISHLTRFPIHLLFFYQLPALTKTHFLKTIVPNLKRSLSITLQHFPPMAGNIIVYPPTSSTIKPEIRYVKGDSVKVTFAECNNLDFNYLTGYHPRNCDKFYHLIPPLGDYARISDYMKIPVFAFQVTLFPNCGISIGMTFHHSVGDASTLFCFLNAWTSIAQFGTDESFLADGTNIPFYGRVINNPPELDAFLSRVTKVETLFGEAYQPPKLCGPTDRIRATFLLPRTMIDQLKKTVSIQLPTLSYVSSFIVTCAYIWCCLAKALKDDDRQLFVIPVDARTRLDPPISATYFGNCLNMCVTHAITNLLKENDGFITAVKLIGENLYDMLNDKEGILKINTPEEVRTQGMPKTMIAISGTPKLRFHDMDFGCGKPKKVETISNDYGLSVSIEAGKESNQDMEISISLMPAQMEAFVTAFNQELPKTILSD
uniref:malonyl-coenzyme A:anthocyanin 3-O-glucoside-6''-O-malonyltransferase-like n=1 Tax=Erigeron canadensis TaxID=72917 RepID=UPI001CB91A64|nr:malonyl-coenzyme A:anthocyanin 3-O-glucoside-6''-O-malonyltransferase-like [Erigeron canadensis]